ncbi:hypothetical protein NP233_g11901 [Leucocoprinus birnbaumii]|uniref:Uncharacterized protein n=1 Tax=Leucocoprinus birnbaumii TaxID=56174 RepID=A0AAD5VI39_9AGAR|nr:hypothetical protein NP233_g11901 [Leucocoprinus birnbaumii]
MPCPLVRCRTIDYLDIGLLYGVDDVSATTESYVDPPGPYWNQLFEEELLRRKEEATYKEKQERAAAWAQTLVNASTSRDFLESPPFPPSDDSHGRRGACAAELAPRYPQKAPAWVLVS